MDSAAVVPAIMAKINGSNFNAILMRHVIEVVVKIPKILGVEIP